MTALQAEASADETTSTPQERQQALLKLDQAVRLFLEAGEEEEAARVLNKRGRLQLLLNSPHEAIHSYRRALRLITDEVASNDEVDSLNGLGNTYLILQERTRAKAVVRRALRLSERLNYVAGQAEAKLTLSDCQNHDNHALALRTALSSLALFQMLGNKVGMARASCLIGRCYFAQDLRTDAAMSYQTGLRLGEEANSPQQQAEALIGLALIAERNGEWRDAIAFFTKAQDLLAGSAAPMEQGDIASGLAQAFNENGLPEIGLKHYRHALECYKTTLDPHAIWYATWGIGATAYILNDWPQAILYLQKALSIVPPTSLEAALCKEYLGRIHTSTGELNAALEDLKSALPIYARARNPMEVARVCGLMGRVFELEESASDARQYYNRALKAFENPSDLPNQADLCYALGRLEFNQGNYDDAERYLQQSIDLTTNLRRNSASTDLAAAFSGTVNERYVLYIDCLMRQFELRQTNNLAIRAFETSESSRGWSLSDLLKATQTDLLTGIDPKLAAEEKSLRESLKLKENYRVTLLSGRYSTKELDDLDREIEQLQADYNKILNSIRERYPAFDQLIKPAALNLSQIRERVIGDDQTLLLEYSLGPDESYVWAVTRDHFASYLLPPRDQIEEAAKKVYELLSSAPGPSRSNELAKPLQELGKMILPPFAGDLGQRRIIIVADGALDYIPFQSLPDPATDDEPLVAHHEIVNTPSASILGELHNEAQRRQPTKTIAAFGDPVFASNYAEYKQSGENEQSSAIQALELAPWQHVLRDVDLNGDTFDPSVVKPLFFAKPELAGLRKAAGGRGVLIRSGFDASRQQLLSADLSQYAILHFATHGFLDSKRPEFSGLVLSTVDRNGKEQNGFVGLQDIYGLRAPVDLVVLSACQTALGKSVRGEGLLGLTRGFMYAGASSVLASLWSVDDRATAELMRQFYTNLLQKGMTPAAALESAQNNIRQRPEWRSPYYWAGFTLQGEYRELIKPIPGPWYWNWRLIPGIVLIVLIACFRYALRRRRRPGTAAS